MKKIFIGTVLFMSISLSYGQKTIILGMYPQVVPQGKKWVIEKNKEALVEFTDFDNYSMCGASVQQNPGTLYSIGAKKEGEENYESYEVNFTSLAKVPYANASTYSLIVTSETIRFYEGTRVLVGTCTNTFTVREYNLSKQDLERIANEKKKKEEIAEKNKIELAEYNENEQKRIKAEKLLGYKVKTLDSILTNKMIIEGDVNSLFCKNWMFIGEYNLVSKEYYDFGNDNIYCEGNGVYSVGKNAFEYEIKNNVVIIKDQIRGIVSGIEKYPYNDFRIIRMNDKYLLIEILLEDKPFSRQLYISE